MELSKHRSLYLILALAAGVLAVSSPAALAATLSVDQNDGGCSDVLGTPYCTIGAAVTAAAPGDTVSVDPGTYVENVLIAKNLSLVSTGGRAVTTIQGISSVGALGAVQIQGTTTAVDVGGPGAGFKIEGIDNGFPGVENAAVYLRGTHSNTTVVDNEVVSIGEAGLLSEFGAMLSGLVVDGNIFSGKTFFGSVPADCGFANQFTTPNVPRQLVTVGGGAGGGNTSNVSFTNNVITGAAGGGLGGACTPPLEQGNTLVTIDSNGATVSGNTFAGTTGRFATSLRSRGPNTSISGNSFSGAGLRPIACHVFIQNIGSDVGTVAGANGFDTPLLLVPNDPLAVVATICPAPDADGDGIEDDADVCADTSIPEATVPSRGLGTNRFALVDGDGIFDTKAPKGKGPRKSFTIQDTAGCSCEQIIEALDLGNGHTKFGCSISAMEDWVDFVAGGGPSPLTTMVAAGTAPNDSFTKRDRRRIERQLRKFERAELRQQ